MYSDWFVFGAHKNRHASVFSNTHIHFPNKNCFRQFSWFSQIFKSKWSTYQDSCRSIQFSAEFSRSSKSYRNNFKNGFVLSLCSTNKWSKHRMYVYGKFWREVGWHSLTSVRNWQYTSGVRMLINLQLNLCDKRFSGIFENMNSFEADSKYCLRWFLSLR